MLFRSYLMTRGQAIGFPSKFFDEEYKDREVYGVVIDLPMSPQLLTTMVCFINGAANLYFNNGGEYTGASQKYRNLVQSSHALVTNAPMLLPKCEKAKHFDIPSDRTHYVFLLTRKGVYRTEIPTGLIPESEPEKRTFYMLYQRVLNKLRNCQLKDDAEKFAQK